MIRHFLFLGMATLRNRARVQLARLKSPQYAIALIFGLGYFYFLIVRPHVGRPAIADPVTSTAIQLVTAVFVSCLVAWWWVAGGDRSALAFSPAEVHLLFPAPVTRRQLIQLKLLRAQLVIVINTLLWVVILGRGGSGPAGWRRAAALWAFFSTLQLHRLGVSLLRESAVAHGRAGRRALVPAVMVGSIIVIVARALWLSRESLARGWSDAEMSGAAAAVIAALNVGPASIALAPVRAVLAPLAAPTLESWLPAFAIAAGIVVLHYFWVLGIDHRFEEAAALASARRADRLSRRALRLSGGGEGAIATGSKIAAPWLPLTPVGRPEGAIVWKNLLLLTRRIPRSVAIGALFAIPAAAAAVGVIPATQPIARIAGMLALATAAMYVLIGPLSVRIDLRRDLVHRDLLRTLPLPGVALVRAEIAGTVLALTAIQFLALLVAFLAFVGVSAGRYTLALRLLTLLAAALVLPAINATTTTIQNGLALVFPAWTRVGGQSAGVEATGQAMLTLIASTVLVAITLFFPLVLGAVSYSYLQFLPLPRLASVLTAAVLSVLLALGVLWTELAWLTRWMGRFWERDASATGGRRS